MSSNSSSSVLQSLDPEVVQNFIDSLPYVWNIVIISSYLAGFVCVGSGIYLWTKPQRRVGGMVMAVIGVLLLNIPTVLNMLSQTFLQVSAPTGLNYVSSTGGDDALIVTAIVNLTILVGLISFIRSLFYFKDWAMEDNPRQLYAGFTFFFGSIFCINIENLLLFVANVLGGEVETLIKSLI